MKSFLILLLSTVFALVSDCLCFETTELRPNKTLNIYNFSKLCISGCLCGGLNHPLQVLVSKEATFRRYPSEKFMEVVQEGAIYNWVVETTSPILLRYPINLFICQHQTQIKNLGDVRIWTSCAVCFKRFIIVTVQN